jgi:hypothetical protein
MAFVQAPPFCITRRDRLNAIAVSPENFEIAPMEDLYVP